MKNEIVMTIPQFLSIQRNEMTYKDLQAENFATYILKDARLTKAFVTLLALSVDFQVVYASTDTVSAKIDSTGNMVLGIMQTIARWVCIIMCLCDITKSLGAGTTKDISKILLKYCMAYATTYLLPFIFDAIKSIFAA